MFYRASEGEKKHIGINFQGKDRRTQFMVSVVIPFWVGFRHRYREFSTGDIMEGIPIKLLQIRFRRRNANYSWASGTKMNVMSLAIFNSHLYLKLILTEEILEDCRLTKAEMQHIIDGQSLKRDVLGVFNAFRKHIVS